MTTNKIRRSKKRRSKKNIDKLDHGATKTKHRRHKRNSVGLFANNTNKGNIVNGLRDFLALKKNK